MPLSLAQPRRPLHTRSIRYEGFKRDDGMWDIEGYLVDTKPFNYALSSGIRRAGDAVHDMRVRVTLDRDFVVRDIEAHIVWMPYPGACDAIAPDYRKLVGASLTKGFRKRVHELLGDVHGCSHLTELLITLPSAAIQTFAGEMRDNDHGETKPFQLDRCHALETSGDTVRRFYPKWYRGKSAASG
jgi:hypothetical protein